MTAHTPDLLAALRRYMAAVKALGRIKDGKTLFEGSPTHDQGCFDAWTELDAAGKAARIVIRQAEGQS